MDVSRIIDVFGESILVLRRSLGNWSDSGVYEASLPPPSQRIDAAVLPVSGHELHLVPEGLRGVENKQFISTFPLRMPAGNPGDADVVVHNSVRYRIHTVTDWSHAAGFWCAIGAREEDG
jgi:hypothetical protein